MNSLSCVHSHCAVFPRRSDARAAQGKKAKCGALAPGESLGRQRAAWWVLSSMRFMSCAFFVGWCGSTKRIHYACVWSIGCRFSYILDFRCVAWEMKKSEEHLCLCQYNQNRYTCQIVRAWRQWAKQAVLPSFTYLLQTLAVKDGWCLGHQQDGNCTNSMAERFWKTLNLYASEGVVRCNMPCSFSAERCEAGWFEFAVGRVCDLASLGQPHSCLLKGNILRLLWLVTWHENDRKRHFMAQLQGHVAAMTYE